jgi:hypothetical protein
MLRSLGVLLVVVVHVIVVVHYCFTKVHSSVPRNLKASAIFSSARSKPVLTRIMANNDADAQSVHLKLRNILVAGHDQQDISPSKCPIVHRFKGIASDETILAAFGSRKSLELFGMHIMGQNLSADPNYIYEEVLLIPYDLRLSHAAAPLRRAISLFV